MVKILKASAFITVFVFVLSHSASTDRAHSARVDTPKELDVSEPVLTHKSLKKMLELHQYKELDRFYNGLIRQYRRNVISDISLENAFQIFRSAIPEHGELLAAWRNHSPASPAALLAHGLYNAQVGWFMRGGAWSKDTPDVRFTLMYRFHRRAIPSLQRVIELQPDNPLAYAALLEVYAANGSRNKQDDLFSQALNKVAGSYILLYTQLVYSGPKWGGSHQLLESISQMIARSWPHRSDLAPLTRYIRLVQYRDFVDRREDERAFNLLNEGNLRYDHNFARARAFSSSASEAPCRGNCGV